MGTSSNSVSTSEGTLILERSAVSRFVAGGVVLRHPGADAPFRVESREGLTLVFGALPWWREPDLLPFPRSSNGLCYLPFQGWKNGVWHDGPLVRLNEAGDVTAFVAIGGAARLTTPRVPPKGLAMEACAPWLEDRDGEGAKMSLTHALRTRFGAIAQASLSLSRHDTREAVFCALMRRAYPEAALAVFEPSLTAPWRRLLQNLGILHGRAPMPDGSFTPVTCETFGDILPAHRLASVLQALQRPSMLIPPRLIDEGRISPEFFRAQDCAKGD